MSQITYISVKSGYDGRDYTIHALSPEQAAEWLLEIALNFGPSQGGIYSPMRITRCETWAES
jgi:hypothetical protein